MKVATAPLLAALLTAGCQNTSLLYVHDTTLGIVVAGGTEGTAKLSFGYDRDTFSLIPTRQKDKDAMSLSAVSCIYAEGLTKLRFNHVILTGTPAENLANASDTAKRLEEYRASVYGGTNKCD